MQPGDNSTQRTSDRSSIQNEINDIKKLLTFGSKMSHTSNHPSADRNQNSATYRHGTDIRQHRQFSRRNSPPPKKNRPTPYSHQHDNRGNRNQSGNNHHGGGGRRR